MLTLEQALFDIHCKEFNKAVDNYKPYDDNAWSFIDLRQQAIMDALVDNERKAQAFDGVLAAIYRIFPNSNTVYCKALEKRLAYTDRHNVADLERIANDAYCHRRDVNIKLYGKIINDAYEMSNRKKTFPLKDTVQEYRDEVKNAQQREIIEDDLGKICTYVEEGNLPPERKLQLLDEAISLINEPYFKKSKANQEKSKLCHWAVSICREEMPWNEESRNYYAEQAFEYERLADNAIRQGKKRRNLWTAADEKKYREKYGTSKKGNIDKELAYRNSNNNGGR